MHGGTWCCRFFGGRPQRGVVEAQRSVTLFQGVDGSSNTVRTSKYTLLTFLPLNLWEQFHNPSNVYFIILIIMQCVPQISVTNGVPYTAVPFTFILALGAARDLWEDMKKKNADLGENQLYVSRLRAGTDPPHTQAHWGDVLPGQVFTLYNSDAIPADMLLLESSGPCHVETMSLDGETTLKPKFAALRESDQVRDLGVAGCLLEFEPPSADLYEFRGALTFADSGEKKKRGHPEHVTSWKFSAAHRVGDCARGVLRSRDAGDEECAEDTLQTKPVGLGHQCALLYSVRNDTSSVYYWRSVALHVGTLLVCEGVVPGG